MTRRKTGLIYLHFEVGFGPGTGQSQSSSKPTHRERERVEQAHDRTSSPPIIIFTRVKPSSWFLSGDAFLSYLTLFTPSKY